MQAQILKQFHIIPGIGTEGAKDLYNLGYRSVEDLRGEDPELMYQRHCEQKGHLVDRCVLYVFRCAVYFASTDKPNPELLRWWRWRD